jgi:transcriptional regulator with XRE-family HTH domain
MPHRQRPFVPRRAALIEARERLGISRSELARCVGIHKGTVGGIEDGYRQPSFALMVRWSKKLGVGLEAWGLDEPKDEIEAAA